MKFTTIFFPLLFLFIISTIVILPIAKRVSDTPNGSFYPLIHLRGADAYYGHLSYIRQGQTHASLINQQTAKENVTRTTHVYYLVLGKISSFFHIPIIPTYYLGLLIPFIMNYVFSYLIVTTSFSGIYKWLGLCIIYFASPFPKEKIHLLGNPISLEPEWWTMQDSYTRLNPAPHHYISIALVTGATYFLIQYLKNQKLYTLVLLGICTNLALFFYVFPAVIFLMAVCVVLLYVFLQKLYLAYKSKKPFFNILRFDDKKTYIVMAAILLISLFQMYYINKGSNQAGISSFELGFYQYTHVPLLTLAGWFFLPFGILPFFFIPFLFSFKKKPIPIKIFLGSIIVIPYILFTLAAKGKLPIPSVRFIDYSPYLFFGLITIYGIQHMIEKIKRNSFRKIILLLVILLFLIHSFIGLKSYWWPEVIRKEIHINTYIPKPFMLAMNYLDNYTPEFSTVMSTFYTGMFIPAFTHNKVYIGNEGESNFPELWWYSEEFMAGKLSSDRSKNLLRENNITYVFWDQGKLPESYASFLKQEFKTEYVTVYKVTL